MVFRLRDFAYPRRIHALRRLLGEAESWDRARLAEWQTARLRELLVHARATCPFWRRRLDDASVDPRRVDLADLADLPLLDKDTVRRHGAALTSSRAGDFDPQWSETSGSTGTALRFLLDRPTNILEFATLWRQFNAAGYRFGERFADLRGHLVHSPSGVDRDLRLNALNLSAFELTRKRARRYAEALVSFQPVMVRGYPSSISRFAAWALEEELPLPAPRAVVTSSETLLETQRRVIERAFRAPVYDYYGQMERVAFAGQCPAGAYHVAPEYGLVELIDENGDPAADGAPGRIVATGLHQRAMPLIRYVTRDVAVRRPGGCPCGRRGPVLARIIGRLEDLIATPDGRHVGRLDAAFKHSPGIRLARILQDAPAAITVEVVPGASYGPNDAERVRTELRRRLGDAIAIELREVADLPLDPSGKLKFVVSTIAAMKVGEAVK